MVLSIGCGCGQVRTGEEVGEGGRDDRGREFLGVTQAAALDQAGGRERGGDGGGAVPEQAGAFLVSGASTTPSTDIISPATIFRIASP
jgi:hypothetical protein